jgi:hypothetical protein
MALDLPVWYLQSGEITNEGKFNDIGQASGVVVSVCDAAGNRHRLLLTVQHALRSGADKQSGKFHPAYRGWPPGRGFNDGTAIPLSVFEPLTPKSEEPFADAQDIAFLKLPPEAAGSPPARLIRNEQCLLNLQPLTIAGFISGSDLVDTHYGIVTYATHPNWRFVHQDLTSSKCILGPGDGAPGPGVSGGGVFKESEFVGIYRGKYDTTGEHLFLSIITIRLWCRERGFELLDPNIANIITGIGTLGEESVNTGLRNYLKNGSGLLVNLRANLGLFQSYKNLHDSLHRVQRQIKFLESAAKGLPETAESLDEFLGIFMGETQTAEAAINSLPGTPDIFRPPEKEWLATFKNALQECRSCMDRGDSEGAPKEARIVRRYLRSEMPRIDLALSNAARAMNLKGLKDLFKTASHLPGLSTEAVTSLETGRNSTEQISQRVDAHLELHNTWQRIDRDLWDAEDSLKLMGTDPEDFEIVWIPLLTKVQALIAADATSQWALALGPLAQTVETCRTTPGFQGLGKSFLNLQKACRSRFFDVDTSLRNLAAEVAAIGESVDNLLTKLNEH